MARLEKSNVIRLYQVESREEVRQDELDRQWRREHPAQCLAVWGAAILVGLGCWAALGALAYGLYRNL